ncbi:hypothetical protein B0T25DRAFT_246454 [Lasiosphaeria hispida]|uniref:FAD-dependent oxidoreductase-like enzyme n=1 Tax=Lasiosphaeria hispida TaxID=260671 RepID=A0AAJ0HEX4_9PEZI|nr:hypothetical protein B0T25DRAFT_246454 [Lasiosphaeria hispida]
MSLDTEQSAQVVNGIPDDDHAGLIDDPATPRDDESVIASSQQTIPSTEAPNSPIDPAASFETELADDGAASIIPSSLTPPPSSQVVIPPGAGAVNPLGFANSQRSGIFSPPATGLNGVRRDATPKFTEPTPQQVASAPIEELRSMVQACVAEQARLRMETAHHKFQYSLLALQADSDAKRAAVEQEMARREVEALRMAENSRQARHDLTVAPEASQAKYQQLKTWYEQALEENEVLNKKFKSAKKVIQQKQDEIAGLADERDMLLNRIRENREHFHLLCSPGGMFHGYATPKTQAAATPVQSRATPRQTPRSTQREARTDRDHSKENFAVLLQALSQENNSAPSTPVTGHRPAPRMPSKHTRNVQSMSSLPTTPIARSRPDTGGLLPSVNLVPQTEPPYRHSRFIPETPTPAKSRERRKSRESTISAEDNEELARQALQSVAAASVSFASRGSQSQHRPPSGDEEEEEVFESQASQAASEMLRRDPRESFEVASSVGNSRDGTPAPADKSAKLQAKLFGGLNKSGLVEKRKFSGEDASSRDQITSPTKKLRAAGGLRDPSRGPTGLGIRYSQEA